MPNREIKDSAAFLPDARSQRLCLGDALKSRSPSAMLHALQAVAAARGIRKLALELAITESQLAGFLDGEDGGHPELITALVTVLLANIDAARAAPATAKVARNGRAGGKTGGGAGR